MSSKKVDGAARIIALCTLFVCMHTSSGTSIGVKNEQKGLAGPRLLDDFCLTPACVHATSKIMRSINSSVKPCEDFYEFACGHYDEKTRIPDQSPQVSPAFTAREKVLSRLQILMEKIDAKTASPQFQALRGFYESCLYSNAALWYDTQMWFQFGVGPVMGTNGWPLIYPLMWNESSFNYIHTFYSLFRFEYKKNVTNNKFNVLELIVQNPFLERHHLKEGLSNYVVQTYFQYMQNFTRHHLSALTDQVKTDLTETLSTEIELFRVQFALDLYTEFFDVTQPKYLNYGAIGWMMGREISESLGVENRYYDIEGNLKPWWDSQSDEMYKTRSKCFVEKYGNYKVDGLNIPINGLATLPKHVADHTGLKAAYSAYTKLINAGLSEKPLLGLEYSPKQLFWINMAVSQCASYRPEYLKSQVSEGKSVSKFRINSAVSNLQEFSNDFGCAAGIAKMNPVEKCSLW